MSAAGGSAERWAQELRAGARKGVWRHLLTLLGVTAHTRRADAQAAACDAGALGEQMTAALLQPLEADGWGILHDRAIPGAHSANADHVLISPGARVFLLDSKLWSAKTGTGTVHPGPGGAGLWHGHLDRSRAIKSLLFEADLVARALGVGVQPVVVMHRAPVAGGGFLVGEVPVVPAGRLVGLLRANDGPRNAGAAVLGRLAGRVLPPHR